MKNQIVLLGLLALCTHSQMSAASPQKSIYHKGWIDFNKNGVIVPFLLQLLYFYCNLLNGIII